MMVWIPKIEVSDEHVGFNPLEDLRSKHSGMHFFLTKRHIQAKSCDGQEVEGHGTQSENGPGALTQQTLMFFSPEWPKGRCSNM